MARAGTQGALSAAGAVGGSMTGYGAVSESQLLDVLYEILAQGRDPHGELTSEQIEAFLHEHARAPKSQAEMLAFFERFGLSTDPEAYGADPELGEIASGLHRERGPNSSIFALDEAPAAEEPVTGSHAVAKFVAPEQLAAVVPAPVTQVVVSKSAAPMWLRASVAALALCLVGAATLSYTHAKDLEDKLAQARLQQRSTDAALTALEQRALQLQGALGQSESGRRELDQSLRSYMAEQATQRAAEQVALQKLLGPRYQTLTAQALSATP